MAFAFGDHRLDIARRELRRGAELIHLSPKAFDLLAFLVRNCDRVVSKDDLVREVWGGRIVSESAITTRINAVRRALRDDGTAQSLVRTFIGRGVRFVGEVTQASETDAPIAGDADNQHQTLPISAERRQLTVMICEIVVSTAPAARLDPEDLRDVLEIYQNTVANIVADAGGYVAKSIGTDIPAYFGYPRAQEHDAEHAVRAALALINRISALKHSSGVLACRVGIATGLVVVGDLSSTGDAREYAVVGEARNLAKRLKSTAPANAVFIAKDTRELVGDIFEYRALGAIAVEGADAPVHVWQALRESNIQNRFIALRSATASRLVGRDEELELLMRRWSRAQARLGQVVLLCGEAGLGKSRLVAAFQDYLGTAERVELRYFCWPHRQDSSLFPVMEQLCHISGFTNNDTPVQQLEKLRTTLNVVRVSAEDITLIADLLSLQTPDDTLIAGLSPQRKKERMLASLIRLIQCFANTKPVLMVFEDVHWIDPSSREFLDLLLEHIRQIPVLLIISYRPEFAPPWVGQPQVSTINLNGLDRHDTAILARSIAGATLLPPEIVKQIADRTDGVPLFVEELTKTILESGLPRTDEDRDAIDGSAIPMTLRASLLARLDHLASQRHLAQIGAAIGREFTYELLGAVAGVADEELAAGLDRLVRSGLIFQRGIPPHAVYSFKHALVQDAAHSSLLRGLRRQLHTRIAEALEVQSPDLVDNQPELFAQHYAEAGSAEKSADFWAKAARRSVERSAMAEAAAQLEKALVQLQLLPDVPERRQRELQVRVALGGALQAVKGFAAPETGLAYARARELWEQLGSPSEFIQLPYGQSLHHVHRGELALAERLDQELLHLSRRRNDLAGLVLGHFSSGRTLLFAGRLASSRSHLEEAIALYNPTAHRSLARQAGIHPQVASRGFLAIALFCLGYPDQALVQSNAALAEARKMAHLPSVAGVLSLGAMLLSLVSNHAGLSDWVGQLVELATEQGFPFWRAQGMIFRGWVEANNGNAAKGVLLLRGGLTAFRTTGSGNWLPHYTSLLARACEYAGQTDEASTLLDDALQIVERTGERWVAAELNRCRGELLLRQGNFEAAAELYRRALNIAREQGAKLWELRAATSLARLLQGQASYTEAWELLAPICSWFTEGSNAEDLAEAKVLLKDLALCSEHLPISRTSARPP